MSDRHWSIKRDGHNRQYRNVGELPFAPALWRDAREGTVYLAGAEVGGRRCAADCGHYIAVTSRVVAAGGGWIHERCAPDGAQRGRVAFHESPSGDDTANAPRVARVSGDLFETIELRMPYDRDVIPEIKACKLGREWASWASDRHLWRVPGFIWPCVRRALIDHGYEVCGDLMHTAGGGR